MEDPRIISALFIFLKMAYYNVLINTRYFHTGGVRSKTMQDEIQSCISELWNLRKDVTRMAGDFHGSVETYRK